MRFEIPLVPTSQHRPKLAIRKGRARALKDDNQEANEQTLDAWLKEYVPATPLDGAILLGVRCHMPIPKSKPKYWKAAARQGRIRPITKPDMDNMLKQIKDAMTRARFWTDDKLVVGYIEGTGKYYSDRPRWEIEVKPFQEG